MSTPYVYVGLTQAPGRYELALMSDNATYSITGSLEEFELLAEAIRHRVTEQREHDAEHRSLLAQS